LLSAKADQSAVLRHVRRGRAKGGFGVTAAVATLALSLDGTFNYSAQGFRKLAEVRGRSRVTGGQRVYITFDVARDGHPFNAADRAVQRRPIADVSATPRPATYRYLRPLPPDYSGKKISVEYWFDYSKK